jgi:hypothetical protein
LSILGVDGVLDAQRFEGRELFVHEGLVDRRQGVEPFDDLPEDGVLIVEVVEVPVVEGYIELAGVGVGAPRVRHPHQPQPVVVPPLAGGPGAAIDK